MINTNSAYQKNSFTKIKSEKESYFYQEIVSLNNI